MVQGYEDQPIDAIKNCRKQGFEIYCPRYRAAPVRGVRAILSVFPSYFFVKHTEHWHPLQNTRGVQHVLMNCEKPVLVRNSVIEALVSSENDIGYISFDALEEPEFAREQLVRAFAGIFEGKSGVFVQRVGAHDARVVFEMIGKFVPVTMPIRNLSAI